MALSATKVNKFLDELSRMYALALGGSSYGIGSTGDTDRAADAAADLETYLAGLGDSAMQLALTRAVQATTAAMDAATLIGSKTRSVYNGLNGQVRALGITGVRTLDAYLSYLNYGVGGTNTALQCPYFRELFAAWSNGTNPTKYNLYFVVKAGTVFDGVTYTNALRKWVVTGAGTGTATAGTAVPNDGGGTPVYEYAGGVPYLAVSGLTGSGVVTVTGTQYDPATQTYTAGKTWTATVSADGDAALASGGGSAASANALIVAVSAISAAAGITAGTIYAQAHAPTSRVAVPL